MVPRGRESGGQDQEGRKKGLNFICDVLFFKKIRNIKQSCKHVSILALVKSGG